MKQLRLKSFILSLFILFYLTAFTGNPDVPQQVMEKLKSLYPEAKKIEWKENHGYEARFIINNRAGISVFDKKGHVVYSKLTISYWALPMPVLQEVKNNYVVKGYTVNKATHSWYKGKDTYDVEVVRDTEDYTLRYYYNGKRVALFDMGKHRKTNQDKK